MIKLKKMKNILLLTLLLSQTIFSQITFEKGYFINNQNQKIDCFIKNIDWLNNPEMFNYKLHEKDAERTANPKEVKEFGIENEFKFVSRKVKIDNSSSQLSLLSNNKDFDFVEETIFLKVLIDGKASLYELIKPNFSKYFYSINNNEIEQLLFKEYKSDNFIVKNEEFKKQLFRDLKCETISIPDVNSISYRIKDLTKFFIEYNNCNKIVYENYIQKKNKQIFNFSIRGRFNPSSIKITNTNILNYKTDFNNVVSFGFGVEAEYILPFNKNKWSIILEPTYQTTTADGTGSRGNVTLKYSSIEIPIGVRHYLYLNDNSKLFMNGSIYFDNSFNSGIYFKDTDVKALEINSGLFLGFGLGYKFQDKYSFEMRYLMNREILSDYVYNVTDYKTISFIIGYTLF